MIHLSGEEEAAAEEEEEELSQQELGPAGCDSLLLSVFPTDFRRRHNQGVRITVLSI